MLNASKTPAPSAPAPNAATATVAPGGARAARFEPLSVYGALTATLLVLSLGVCAVVLMAALSRQERAALEQNAPATMKMISAKVSEAIDGPVELLKRRLNEALRLAGVSGCRLTRKPLPQAAAEPPATAPATAGLETFAAGELAPHITALTLEASVEGAKHEGRLTVMFVPRSGLWREASLWSSAGLVAVAALGLFFVIYRMMRSRLRALQFVRENLMAYGSGAERAVELLGLQAQVSEEASAWNSLVGFVAQLQQELDGFRARQAVVGAMQTLHAQAARAILDIVPIGVLRIDAGGRLVYTNSAAQRLLSFREAAAGELLSERLENAELCRTLTAMRQSPNGTGLDFRIDFAGGYTVVRLTPLLVTELGEDEVIVTVQDVTQLKEAERSREEFLAHITHELRTPLTNIRAYSETLNEDFFDDEQTRRECYNVIMSETRRLSKLIEDVLSATQIDAGVARLSRQAVRIDESLRKAVQEIQASAESKRVELALKLPSKLPAAFGDAHRLHQVWINLIGNAVKYTPSGGSVSIDAQGEGSLVRVRITDTGIGIPPEFHERIFEKFFRVEDPRVDAEEGTGLGLAITREIVRLHGGFIRVESDAGVGTTFSVELPVAGEAASAPAKERENAANRRR